MDVTEPTGIEKTLTERGGRYGDFKGQSVIAMALKNTLRYEWSDDLLNITIRPGWARLEPYQQNALDMICDKIARAINGDPTYLDNYRDIAGYATLIITRLELEGYGHG